MNIFEALGAAIRGRLAKAEPPPPTTSGVVDTQMISTTLRQWGDTFSLDMDRASRYDDFDQMDYGDMATVLDEVVEQTLTFDEVSEDPTDPLLEARCFKLDLDVGERHPARRVISDLLVDTEIRDLLPQITRDMLKYGDEFDELLWVGDEIKGIQPHFIREMHVGVDPKGRPLQGVDEKGYPKAYQQRSGTDIVHAGWEPFEMLHFKLYPTKKQPYSRAGFFDPIRWDWKKLNWLEQGMVVARTTRAYPRLLWKRDMTGVPNEDAQDRMKRFIMAITRKKTGSGSQQKAPMQPDEDYFVSTGYYPGTDGKMYPKTDGVELLDPQIQGLAQIADVNYMRRKLFGRVPASSVGIIDQATAGMTPQDMALARFVNHVQDMLELRVRTLIDRSLAAQGLTCQYRIIWPRPQIRNDWMWADAGFRKSMEDQNYLGMGVISKSYIRRQRFGMTQEEADAEDAQIKKETPPEPEPTPGTPTTNSGQGGGKGSGTVANKNDTTSKSNQRTAGFNSTKKEELQRQHEEQLQAIS